MSAPYGSAPAPYKFKFCLRAPLKDVRALSTVAVFGVKKIRTPLRTPLQTFMTEALNSSRVSVLVESRDWWLRVETEAA